MSKQETILEKVVNERKELKKKEVIDFQKYKELTSKIFGLEWVEKKRKLSLSNEQIAQLNEIENILVSGRGELIFDEKGIPKLMLKNQKKVYKARKKKEETA